MKVGSRKFLLVHSGLGNFSEDKDLDDYSLEELTYIRPDFDKKYFEDENFYIVSGHTPTLAISGKPKIYKNKNNICIDCGATFDGKLACLCLIQWKNSTFKSEVYYGYNFTQLFQDSKGKTN